MKPCPKHANEAARLVAVERLMLMDSAPEKEFDDISMLAALACDAPIAFISLVDATRSWFKSRVGLNFTEVPRDTSVSSWVILENSTMMVQDALQDERFRDHPMVIGEPNLRFVAGAPLFSPETPLPVGALCVLDTKARTLSPNQLAALEALVSQAQRVLELRVQNHKLKCANESFILQKTAFDNMSEGVVLHARSGAVLDFNPMALALLQLTSSQLLGRTPLSPDWKALNEDGTALPTKLNPSLMALTTGVHQKNVVMGIQNGDEQIQWLSLNAVPLYLDGQESPSHAVTTLADITEQKFYFQALLHSSNLAALGEMAGGIAHEINTPLATICTATELVRLLLKKPSIPIEQINGLIDKIDSTAQRVAKIVKGLRTFARDSEEDPWLVSSMSDIVTDALDLCSEKMRANGIKISLDYSHDFMVYCVPTQISQVILNLLSNAHDAIAELPEKWIKISLEESDRKARLSITDSGHGIEKKIQEKIMRPFFTTKEVGKGTGLGLSISAGIAQKFLGKLYYDPSDKNTKFILELPIYQIAGSAEAA